MNAAVSRMNLRPVLHEVDRQEAEEQAAAAIEKAASELEAEAGETEPATNKTLIRRSRASLVTKSDGLGEREAELRIKMAAARTARDNLIAKANADYLATEKDVDADLYQIGTVRKVLDAAIGDLTKAEL